VQNFIFSFILLFFLILSHLVLICPLQMIIIFILTFILLHFSSKYIKIKSQQFSCLISPPNFLNNCSCHLIYFFIFDVQLLLINFILFILLLLNLFFLHFENICLLFFFAAITCFSLLHLVFQFNHLLINLFVF